MTEAGSVNHFPTLDSIQAVVAEELKEFRRVFRDTIREKSGLLSTILRHVLRRKGKRIRPTLVFLSAKVCGGITDSSFRAATLLELIHTATLVHDDVVDEADTRRGAHSVNALWGNKVAVLVGDYFLSKGLLLALEHDDVEMLRILSDVVRRMTKGELLQIKEARHLDLDEATYFRIISDKTASLISACTTCGAVSAQADPADVQRMQTLGEKLGLAFQIRDDLFDYGPPGIGKPVGLDFKKKPITLPLIHALSQTSPQDTRKVKRLLRQGREHEEILAFVKDHGGLDYARDQMHRQVLYVQELLETFPESPARAAMHSLAEYVISRKR